MLSHQLTVCYSPEGYSVSTFSVFLFLWPHSVLVTLSFRLSPVSFQCQGSACYPMSWQVQRSKASGLVGFITLGLHGAALSQMGFKCVGRGSSHHFASQTPSTSNSEIQNILKVSFHWNDTDRGPFSNLAHIQFFAVPYNPVILCCHIYTNQTILLHVHHSYTQLHWI